VGTFKITSILQLLFQKNRELTLRKPNDLHGLHYWEDRVQKYGKRSVLNTGHSEEEFDSVTQMQKDILFPLLKKELKGDEKLILDFGCGPGRFTFELADMISGKAIGADPIEALLAMAPKGQNVEYALIRNGEIPLQSESADVVWICLVMGGITDEQLLQTTINEIGRVLKRNGLLFLVENTSEAPDAPYWKYRTVGAYQNLFNFVDLRHLSEYYDLNERISVMSGRKHV
jgi:SAM-dependent methyltransferase